MNIHGYIGPYHYSQYRQLLQDLFLFLILLVSVFPFAPATVDGARSGIGEDTEATCTGNGTDARSDLEGDTRNNRLAVLRDGSKTDTG